MVMFIACIVTALFVGYQFGAVKTREIMVQKIIEKRNELNKQTNHVDEGYISGYTDGMTHIVNGVFGYKIYIEESENYNGV